MAPFQITDEETKKLRELVARFNALRKVRDEQHKPILFRREYELTFDPEERELLERFEHLGPADFGVAAEFISVDEADDLMSITGQRYRKTKEAKVTTLMGPRYLSRPAWAAFTKLQRAMQKDLGRTVLVASGYRSPKHQLLRFIEEYLIRKGDMEDAIRRVGVPGTSQHQDPVHTAVDLLTEDGIYQGDFSGTAEYKWLQEHAAEYGFEESFPQKNDKGMRYEPWHWRYVGQK